MPTANKTTLDLNSTVEELNLSNARRAKAPITYAIKDTASFIGGFARLASDEIQSFNDVRHYERQLDKKEALVDYAKESSKLDLELANLGITF